MQLPSFAEKQYPANGLVLLTLPNLATYSMGYWLVETDPSNPEMLICTNVLRNNLRIEYEPLGLRETEGFRQYTCYC